MEVITDTFSSEKENTKQDLKVEYRRHHSANSIKAEMHYVTVSAGSNFIHLQ